MNVTGEQDIADLKQAGYVVAALTVKDGAITFDEPVAENHEIFAPALGPRVIASPRRLTYWSIAGTRSRWWMAPTR